MKHLSATKGPQEMERYLRLSVSCSVSKDSLVMRHQDAASGVADTKEATVTIASLNEAPQSIAQSREDV